jgi:uncharacterized membrane protein YphA (DoxX/SURF4 family)
MPRALEGAMTDAGLLAGRLLLVFIFLHEGWSILGNYAGAAAYMQKPACRHCCCRSSLPSSSAVAR